MKKSKTALLVGASVLTIGGTGLGATASATNKDNNVRGNSSWNWHWNRESDDKFDAELSAAFAAKYNVDKAEVAALVETVRDNQFNILDEERQATLDKALKDEKITQDQYDTISRHLSKIDKLYDRLDDVDGSERRQVWNDIKNEFKDLKTYLKTEGISLNLDLKVDYKHHDNDHMDRD